MVDRLTPISLFADADASARPTLVTFERKIINSVQKETKNATKAEEPMVRSTLATVSHVR